MTESFAERSFRLFQEAHPPKQLYFVYGMALCDRSEEIKIGFTVNLAERTKQILSVRSPFYLKVRCASACLSKGEAISLETKIHRCLKHLRLEGEWFRNKDEEVFNFLLKRGFCNMEEFGNPLQYMKQLQWMEQWHGFPGGNYYFDNPKD